MSTNEEEVKAWEDAAAAHNGGKGIPLREINPDDEDEMEILAQALARARALDVGDDFAIFRLRKFIRSLRQQQQSPLRLFELVYNNIPSGSSGVPHIHHDLEDFPMNKLKSLQLKKCPEKLFERRHQEDVVGQGKVSYSREIQVQDHCEHLVMDIIESCNYGLQTDKETSLNGLKVDVGMIRKLNDTICGTMEVKQPRRQNVVPPDPDPMNHPKVITQVLSQMIPLRTMYGVQNVYGILSTYSSWRFFKWVPAEDEDGQKQDLHSSDPQNNNSLLTLRKSRSKSEVGNDRGSPPMSPKPYVDSGTYDDEEEDEELDSNDVTQCGTLYASSVISDGALALTTLAWVLGEMERSPVTQLPAHQRDFLYVVKKDDALGGYERLRHDQTHYKGRMPNAKNGTLYVLEELGHRHHGRVYRAMSKNGNLCVLKYFVKGQYAVMSNGKRKEISSEATASKSVEYWNKAYDRWLPSISAGKWGGGDAIVMPDLEKMSVQLEPKDVLPMLKQTMRERFYDKGIWHGDASWRNVALVRNAGANISKVCMIDLEPQGMIDQGEISNWDFDAMWLDFEGTLVNDWEQFKVAEHLETL